MNHNPLHSDPHPHPHPHPRFDDDLKARLRDLHRENLSRRLRRIESAQGTRLIMDGAEYLSFASNDYLSLANHPALKEAAIRAVRDYGAGAGASRLICGSLAPAHDLEEALAAFMDTEAALTFSSGYSTAIGTITALLETGDTIILDKRVHACMVDAARMSSATIRVFHHNDLEKLERILKRIRPTSGEGVGRPSGRGRVLIVTESVFSMDGDVAPLAELVELKNRYGAWLMLDEAHATGILGDHGRGLAEAVGVADQIEIHMGTLGKAIGAAGGYVCGSRSLIDFLVNRARSFIFSTAPPPAPAASARAGIEIMRSGEGAVLRDRLRERILEWRALQTPGGDRGGSVPVMETAIFPWMIGDEAAAVDRMERLLNARFFVPAVRYPTVARGAARMRISLSAAHTSDDLKRVAQALQCPLSQATRSSPIRDDPDQ